MYRWFEAYSSQRILRRFLFIFSFAFQLYVYTQVYSQQKFPRNIWSFYPILSCEQSSFPYLSWCVIDWTFSPGRLTKRTLIIWLLIFLLTCNFFSCHASDLIYTYLSICDRPFTKHTGAASPYKIYRITYLRRNEDLNTHIYSYNKMIANIMKISPYFES